MSILAQVPKLLRVKRERLERGLRQRDVAEAAGLGQPELSRIEKGKSFPSVRVRSVLASYYGISEESLFEDMFWWDLKVPAQRLPKMPKFKPKGAE